MSAGEKSEKTSSADSGSSQNYAGGRMLAGGRWRGTEHTYACPVVVVGGDLLGLREAEDALLEAEFGVGRAHWNASLGSIHESGQRGGGLVVRWEV